MTRDSGENKTTAVQQEVVPSHTPGPWMVRDLPSKWQVATDADALGGLALAVIDMAKSESPTPEYNRARLADLRLIAAAPEMLEALYAIQRGFADGSIQWARPRRSDSDPYHPANTATCAAIAKAEGRDDDAQ